MKGAIQFESSLQALAQLAALCKRAGLVRELAARLTLTRQSVYLWASEGCKLSNRTAKLRLLEISRLSGAGLAGVVAFAKQAVETIEAQEKAAGSGKEE